MSAAVIAQARVKRASDATEVVPLEVSARSSRPVGPATTRSAPTVRTRETWWEQVGDWEMEIIPPDDMDVARTTWRPPVAPQTAVRAVGGRADGGG